MNIAENIKKYRKLYHLEQQELAYQLHISDKTVSSWECGRTEPRMGMIEAMCEIFQCDKSELIVFIHGAKKNPEHRINTDVSG